MSRFFYFNKQFCNFIFSMLFLVGLSGATFGATFTVTKTADTNDNVCDADCSLREAIATANAAASDDTINFNTDVFNAPQTITLGGTQLTVANNGKLTVNGTGANLTTISGNIQSRVFNISAGAMVTINGLKITGGFENQAGGIVNYGTLNITNSLIANNKAVFIGGGIYNAAINATLIITDSIFDNNLANDYDGGGILSDGTLNVSNSIFINNGAGGYGGGISSRSGTTEIINTVFTGNRANNGGGISISYNEPNVNSIFTIRNSLLNNNNATSQGGGINTRNGTLNLINVTVTTNAVTVGNGGGIAVVGSTVNLINATIANNAANGLMGIGGGVYHESGVFNSRSSIIAGNTAGLQGADFRGTLISQGYNLIGNTSNTTITGTTTGNIIGQDPMLGALQDNGGRTQTRALLAGSPAIDAADPGNFPATDQRGASRPLDGDLNGSALPDIGAFETGAKIITKTADTNDNVCDADCSLREAVAAANNSAANDAIVFSSLFNSPQTIILSGTVLTVMNSGTLVISGPGANLLTVSGNNSSGIFSIMGDAMVTISDLTVANGNSSGYGGGIYNGGRLTLNNLIISNSVASFGGGGIYNDKKPLNISGSIIRNNSNGIYNNEGTLTITNSILTGNTGAIANSRGTLNLISSVVNNNTAPGGAGIANIEGNATLIDSIISNNSAIGYNGSGGGIMNFSGGSSNPASMTITNSRITANTTEDGGGGGLVNISASLSIINSTIDNNRAMNDEGGGLYIFSGTFSLNKSTVNNNIAAIEGGGIYNGNAISTITNSTITNNTSNRGGGIYSDSGNGPLNIISSTITNNTATSRGGGISRGGGGAVIVSSSIVADNSANAVTTPAPDFSGILTSQGSNLIENTDGTIITGTTTGNILGRDPQLAPLRNNGGATQTVALLPTSPAIDAADPGNFPATDQRGVSRPQDGDLNGSALPDIGAYERQVTAFTTTKLADTSDGVCNADCSLREAIAAAGSATTPDNAIVFNPATFNTPQTLTLTGGELQINNTNGTFTIIGAGANLLTVSGNNQSRVFNIGASASAAISGMRITGGNSTTNGGSIYNAGRLSLSSVSVVGNSAANYGGGIFNNDGAVLNIFSSAVTGNTAAVGGGISIFTNSNLSVANSTVGGNVASSGYGGGISNNAGTLNVNNSTINSNNGSGIYNGGIGNINNSTISGNSAPNGGGIFSDVILNLTNTTIANNTAATYGGGIFTNAGTVNVRGSIIADNSSNTGVAPDFSGNLVSQGYNLIENTNGATITGTTVGNILNQDPRLLPLGNYGGATQTHALRSNSPAIDKGSGFGFSTDQRGQTRPIDFPNIPNTSGGNGSDIGAFERQPTDVSGSTAFDFDGDGRSDLSVFRPSNGVWYLQQSTSGFAGVAFGASGDLITPADFDGDGKTDIAVFRPSNGTWYLQRSQLGFTGIGFGASGDIPMPADFDGDGKADLAVFRPSNGVWYIQQSTAGFVGVAFGANGDVPVAADYDGDGKADVGVFRSSNGTWYLQRSQTGFTGVLFGASEDKPVPADYDGDGKADLAVFRPSNGTWYLQQSTAGFNGVLFGASGDSPVPADYDGDGKADVSVFRPSNGVWYLNRSAQGFTGISFGANGDIPAPNAFIH